MGLRRVLGGLAAGRREGVSLGRGRGGPGGDAASGEGLFRGAAPAGGGSLSAALRFAAERSGQRRRRGAAAALRGAGAFPPTRCMPPTAARSLEPWPAAGLLPILLGFFK